MSKQTDQLDQEILEMEALMTKGDTTVPEEDTTVPLETTEEVVDTSPELREQVQVEADVPEKKQERTNWKQRYTKLRSHHDSLVHDLRQEVAHLSRRGVDLSTQNEELSKKLKDLASTKVDDMSYLTQEERDVLGEDAVSALTKATRQMTDRAINPLQEQLDKERSLRIASEKRQAEAAQAAVNTSFLSRLGKLVPNYAEVDLDPAFGAWMDQQDDVSGYTRKQLFKRAEANGDVGRVAEFFNAFTGKSDPLAEHVTPTGTRTANPVQPVPEESKIIPWAYVEDFYNRAARGEYKNNMSAFHKEEARIDKATMEGRVK